jgi:uncharacterized protein (DUF1684 family)
MHDLVEERKATLASFKDAQASPLAIVARHDFAPGHELRLGGAPDDDVVLEGVAPHAATLRAHADHFTCEREGRSERLEPGARLQLGRYTIKLSHQNFPAALVLDPQSPRLREGPFPVWFDPDDSFRVEAKLVPDEPPKEIVVTSTRGNQRRALRLGRLAFTLQGKELALTAVRLLEPGIGEAEVSVFFRDATTGKESYAVGRYLDATPLGGGRYSLDFNRAYNPICAFSPHNNCPLPPRENTLPLAVRAGERDPGHP